MTDNRTDGDEPIVSVGERLKRAREARGMSLDDVAMQTRIPIRPPPAYRAGGLGGAARDHLCDRLHPFLCQCGRARWTADCRRAAQFDRRPAPPHPAAEYYEPADPARVPPRSLAIAALILAALLIAGYLIWRSTLDDGAGPASIPVTEAPAGPAPATPAAPAPATPQAAAGQPVTLAATGDVWLRISDGATTLFSGSLAAGQTYAVPPAAAHPMLRTGRPQLLRASLGASDIGPLEATEHTVDNVSLLPQDLAARPRVQAAPAPPPQ